MNTIVPVGVSVFFDGAGTFFALLFASGGLQNSRQFAVLGQLWAGKLGAGRRNLSLASLGLAVVGGLTCFVGVAASDAQRAKSCDRYCVAEGYAQGKIGPSVDRSPKGRFVACTCSAPDRASFERRADSVPSARE